MDVVRHIIIDAERKTRIAVTETGDQVRCGIIVFGRHNPEFESESQSCIEVLKYFSLDPKQQLQPMCVHRIFMDVKVCGVRPEISGDGDLIGLVVEH